MGFFRIDSISGVIFLLLFGFASLAEGSEFKNLDLLIAITEKSLATQKELKDTLIRYNELQEEYLKDPNQTELLVRLVKVAGKAQRLIEHNQFAPYFSQDFLKELDLLAQASNKQGIPRP